MRCPKCDDTNQPRHSEDKDGVTSRWYICLACRHAFKTIAPSDPDGVELVVSQSPAIRERNTPKSNVAAHFPCPDCGSSGRIKWTGREGEDYFRRHVCRTCELVYYSCTTEETTTVMRKLPSKRAIYV